MTIKELENYCTEKANNLYPTNSNDRECFRQGFSEAVRLLVLNNSKKERCINKYQVIVNPNTPASTNAICHSIYDCENCKQFKENVQK